MRENAWRRRVAGAVALAVHAGPAGWLARSRAPRAERAPEPVYDVEALAVAEKLPSGHDPEYPPHEDAFSTATLA